MGFSHPMCYARVLGDCSTTISREHYISKALQLEIGVTPEIRGASFVPRGTERRIGIGSLTAKVLCDHHNTALSPLDSLAARLFETIKRFDRELGAPDRHAEFERVVFDGYALERWLLKVYCGLHAAKIFRVNGAPSVPTDFEKYIIDALFRGKELPEKFGLYFAGRIGDKITFFNGVGITPLSIPGTDVITAIVAEVFGLRFYCTVRPARPGGSGSVDGGQRHPIGIELKSKSARRELEFSWSHGEHADEGVIRQGSDARTTP